MNSRVITTLMVLTFAPFVSAADIRRFETCRRSALPGAKKMHFQCGQSMAFGGVEKSE